MLSAMVGRCTPRSNLSLTNRAHGEGEREGEGAATSFNSDRHLRAELRRYKAISEKFSLILSVFLIKE